jgi:2-polyprenyl-6-hydroxyphenyl methylase/3-demethylubiquinone-9 3-methyltransferase
MANKNTNNVDVNEVQKFNLLAHKWWDETSEFKPLHEINPLRLNYIKSKVNLSEKTVLDVGCGGGILTEALAREGSVVTGIDQGEKVIQIAKLHGKESKLTIDYKHMNIENFLKINKEKFDIITCLEMLEHVPNPRSIINACASLLKPGGHLFFSTINKNPKSFLYVILGAEYILNLLPKGTHEYNKFITPSQLREWCIENALDFKDITGMTYNPLTQKYRLCNNVSVNYLVEVRSLDG